MASEGHALGRSFGGVIRQLREARGWSQERLAGHAELNRSYMGEIERGAVVPSIVTADKLARALDVPLSQLFARCEVPPRDAATLNAAAPPA